MPIMDQPIAVHQMYQRYGGLGQLSPLTAEEQKYDDTRREIDALEAKIGEKSMALFTASEFIWFNAFVTKVHLFPKQEQLDHQLLNLRDFLASLEARERR